MAEESLSRTVGTAESRDELPRCPCGHTRRDRGKVVVKFDYSFWGSFALIILGSSVLPKRATVRCVYCQQVVEEITDPEVLRNEMQGY